MARHVSVRVLEGYKSLIGWQRASALCLATLELVDAAWKAQAAGLFEQLRRAAVSADVNLVEGYALNTVPLFRKHARIALGSAAEVERLLEIGAIRGYLAREEVEKLRPLVDGTIAALVGLVRSPRLGRPAQA